MLPYWYENKTSRKLFQFTPRTQISHIPSAHSHTPNHWQQASKQHQIITKIVHQVYFLQPPKPKPYSPNLKCEKIIDTLSIEVSMYSLHYLMLNWSLCKSFWDHTRSSLIYFACIGVALPRLNTRGGATRMQTKWIKQKRLSFAGLFKSHCKSTTRTLVLT